MTFALIWG